MSLKVRYIDALLINTHRIFRVRRASIESLKLKVTSMTSAFVPDYSQIRPIPRNVKV